MTKHQAMISRFILISTTLTLANCLWLSPCGYVYNPEQLLSSSTIPNSTMHDLRHLVHRVTQHLAKPQLEIFSDLQYERNWIPDDKTLHNSTTSKNLRHVLPKVIRSLRIFAFALHISINSMRADYYATWQVNINISALLDKILKINAQMICQTDIIMRKYNVRFKKISIKSDKDTVPADWLKSMSNSSISSSRTYRKIRQDEVFLKYQKFLRTLLEILSE